MKELLEEPAPELVLRRARRRKQVQAKQEILSSIGELEWESEQEAQLVGE
jgi:hypothetical protein